MIGFEPLGHHSITYMARIFSVLILFASLSATAERVRFPSSADRDEGLAGELLLEALKRGGKYTPTFPYEHLGSTPLSAILNGMDTNEVDLFMAVTSKEYEKEYLPVYIPLFRGLMGMRICIVRGDNTAIFKGVNSLSDLKEFSAGQGELWADTDILEANDLTVVKELKYPNLFRMLEADRFDYFPRALHEPWSEIAQVPDLNLTVESSIMLSYKAPFYVFVHKSNSVLADHLTEQLELMVRDGTFLEMFYRDKKVSSALEQARVEDRIVIDLKNPFLTPGTQIDRPELWYSPKEER